MPSDGRAQLESRITRGTRTIPSPLHPVTGTDEPVRDVAGVTGEPEPDHRQSGRPQSSTAVASTGSDTQDSDAQTIPRQGTAFLGPATHPLYVRVHPEISEWLEAAVNGLRRHRSSRAEIVEMLLWEQRDAPADQLADRLRAFRWETGRR